MKTVVIIEGLETSKVSPYEHPSVLAKKAEVRAEINKYCYPKGTSKSSMLYMDRKVLKEHKKSYKKLSTDMKENFLKDILTMFIKNMPNWNFTVSQAK